MFFTFAFGVDETGALALQPSDEAATLASCGILVDEITPETVRRIASHVHIGLQVNNSTRHLQAVAVVTEPKSFCTITPLDRTVKYKHPALCDQGSLLNYMELRDSANPHRWDSHGYRLCAPASAARVSQIEARYYLSAGQQYTAALRPEHEKDGGYVVLVGLHLPVDHDRATVALHAVPATPGANQEFFQGHHDGRVLLLSVIGFGIKGRKLWEHPLYIAPSTLVSSDRRDSVEEAALSFLLGALTDVPPTTTRGGADAKPPTTAHGDEEKIGDGPND